MPGRPGFGSYFLALFSPPLYFLSRGRWGAMLLNGFFFVLSVPLMFVFGIGFVTLTLCVAHAMFDLRGELKRVESDHIADLVSERVAAQQAHLEADRQQQSA
jgi:hypothetical protein